jgi:thiamine pyrophosphate-dependent acetolactate synthase large subunit-like protein
VNIATSLSPSSSRPRRSSTSKKIPGDRQSFPVDIGIVADAKSALKSLIECYSKVEPTAELKLSAWNASARPNNKPTRKLKAASAKVGTHADQRSTLGTDNGQARRKKRIDRQREPDQQRYLDGELSVLCRARLFLELIRRLFGLGIGRGDRRQLASPKRRVVACLGDGSTMFGLQGLWTLAEISRSVGRHRVQQPSLYGGEESVPRSKNESESPPKWARNFRSGNQFRQMAETLASSASASNIRRIEPALKRALEQNGPALVDVVISQNTRKD